MSFTEGGSFQSYFEAPLPSHGFHLIQEPQQIQRKEQRLQLKPREVLESLPEVQDCLERKVMPNLIHFPDQVTIIGVIGESGIQKGTLIGQIGLFLAANEELQGRLAEANKELAIHYASTASMLKTAVDKGLIPLKWGEFEPEHFTRATADLNDTLALAITRLPRMDPSKTNLILLELIAVTPYPYDIGASIVETLARSQNYFNFTELTNYQIQERSYLQRKGLWTPDRNKDLVLKTSRTSFDMPADEAVYTMGNAEAIELVNPIVEEAMIQAMLTSTIRVPVDYKPDDVRTIFTPQGVLFNNPRKREFVQEQYYKHQAEKWGLINNVTVKPPFLDKLKIHYYPGFLQEHNLPADVILNYSE